MPKSDVILEPSVASPYTGTGVMDDSQSIGIGSHVINARSMSTGRLTAGYEDYFGGNIRCPTCDGTGKVSRESEHELVALIPVSDKRLHPRRTTLYVGISVGLCVIIAGLLLFFLFPRSISLRSNQPSLVPVATGFGPNHTEMYMTIVNAYNVTNENFYQVTVESVTAGMFFNQRILDTITNQTAMSIPMKSTRVYSVTLNATFSQELDYVIQYCWTFPGGSFLVPFQAMATFTYFLKSEQMTLNTYQYVHCPKNHGSLKFKT